MRRIILLAALVAATASLAHGQNARGVRRGRGARAAIEAANRKFIEAFNRGDAAAVAALYVDDAKLLPPNSQMLEGRRNVQTFWQGVINAGVKADNLETLQVEAGGDIAAEVGRYALTARPAGGQAATDNGKYVVVWKRQRGAWKIAVDTWNTDAPAPRQ